MKHIDHKLSPTMNLINYMSEFTNNTEFQGFIPISGDYIHWGVVVDGHNFCAMHLFKKPYKFQFSDDPKELHDIEKGLLFIMVFYGSDNASYIRRFKTKEQALKWIENHQYFVITDNCYFYNS